jgi:hypothetical protein
MIGTLVMFTFAVLAAPTQTDTTITVPAGTRLELNNFSGTIAVQTWSRNSVRIAAEHSSRARLSIERTGSALEIGIVHWRGIPGTVDYELTVPKWMSLDLGGVSTDISVENSAGEIKAQSVQGEISVSGGSKIISASSVEGEVHVFGASGKIECSSVNAAVLIEQSTGVIAASSVNGEILLRRIDSDDVEASTVNGEIAYQGTIRDGGSYRFGTHQGDVSVVMPDRANATVSVGTYNGEFSSAFPVKLDETRHGKRFNFTIGNGSARVELESFQGEIQLRRAGDPQGKSGFEYRYDYDKAKAKAKHKEKTGHSKGDPDDENDEKDE